MKDRKIADAFACVLRDSPVWLWLWSPHDLCVSNFLSSSSQVALFFYDQHGRCLSARIRAIRGSLLHLCFSSASRFSPFGFGNGRARTAKMSFRVFRVFRGQSSALPFFNSRVFEALDFGGDLGFELAALLLEPCDGGVPVFKYLERPADSGQTVSAAR